MNKSVTLYPSSASDVGGGDASWSNPNNIFTENGSYATSDLGKNESTNRIRGYNHGFIIPSNATILGIKLDLKIKAEKAGDGTLEISDEEIYLTDTSGNTKTSNYANAQMISDSNTWVTYGGATDMWGTTWTPANINNSNFGSRTKFENHATGLGNLMMYFDAEKITVYYTVPDAMLLILGAF